MIHVQAPARYDGSLSLVFLAGGVWHCPDWQSDALRHLGHAGVAVANPRPGDHPDQEAWNAEHLERAEVILFWFAGGESFQPTALDELDRYGQDPTRRIVVGASVLYRLRSHVELHVDLLRPGLPVYSDLAATCAAAAGLVAGARL